MLKRKREKSRDVEVSGLKYCYLTLIILFMKSSYIIKFLLSSNVWNKENYNNP